MHVPCHEDYLVLKMTSVGEPELRVYNNYTIHKQRITGM